MPIVLLLFALLPGSSALAQAQTAGPSPAEGLRPAGATPVLDTSGFWRVHYTISPPVVAKGGAFETVQLPAKWLMRPTDAPAEGWTKPDFDDTAWPRFSGTSLGVCIGYGYVTGDAKVPFLGQVALRGRFEVTDPAKVKGLTLSATYRGGIIVTLNGVEVARGHMGAKRPKGLADAYGDGKDHDRKLAQGSIPTGLLRKGVNVLTVEVVRAPYNPDDVKSGRRGASTIEWGSCGLLSLRLSADGAAGLKPNVARPKGLQVWNSNTMKLDTDLDFGDPNEALRAVRIVGARGGAFSGKVVVGSDKPIKGLVGRMSDLGRRGGGGSIPASAVEVRYAMPGYTSAGIQERYLAPTGCLDTLLEAAPAEVPVRTKSQNSRIKNMVSPGVSPSFGAVCGIWTTVNVPADAAAGVYEGTLTIGAAGARPVEVAVELDVSDWKLPAPHEFVTWVDIMQSPESVAMQYEVPIWSDAHFKYLDKSLALLGTVGNKVTHIYLISRTNAGNEQTMVRWIKKADGSYRWDFTPMERYMDLVEKRMVKPQVVCLYVWDTYLEGGQGGAEQYAGAAVKEARAAAADDGPIVSMLGADGKVTQVPLPKYSDPAKSLPMWQPLMTEITKRLEKRGLKGAMTLGISTDNQPTKEVVEFFAKAAPGVPWMSHGHAMPDELHGVRVGYLTGVWAGGKFPQDPTEGRTYGWQRTFAGLRSNEFSPKGGAVLVHHPRNAWYSFPISSHRLVGEMNITGQQRGFARLGGDFWDVLKDRRGRSSSLAARFPETNWRNLDIRSCLLAAGPDGAVSTHRFEMLREGIEECEARIFIEKAILDKKIDGALAKRAQAVLDERIAPMRLGVCSLGLSGAWTMHAYIDNQWWQSPGSAGSDWYTGSGWQERSKKLYDMAAEVAAKTEGR